MVGSLLQGSARKIWGSTDEGQQEISDRVVQEVRWYAAISATLSRGFYGRQGLLGKLRVAMWESTDVQHGPLMVHGAVGMGQLPPTLIQGSDPPQIHSHVSH